MLALAQIKEIILLAVAQSYHIPIRAVIKFYGVGLLADFLSVQKHLTGSKAVVQQILPGFKGYAVKPGVFNREAPFHPFAGVLPFIPAYGVKPYLACMIGIGKRAGTVGNAVHGGGGFQRRLFRLYIYIVLVIADAGIFRINGSIIRSAYGLIAGGFILSLELLIGENLFFVIYNNLGYSAGFTDGLEHDGMLSGAQIELKRRRIISHMVFDRLSLPNAHFLLEGTDIVIGNAVPYHFVLIHPVAGNIELARFIKRNLAVYINTLGYAGASGFISNARLGIGIFNKIIIINFDAVHAVLRHAESPADDGIFIRNQSLLGDVEIFIGKFSVGKLVFLKLQLIVIFLMLVIFERNLRLRMSRVGMITQIVAVGVIFQRGQRSLIQQAARFL